MHQGLAPHSPPLTRPPNTQHLFYSLYSRDQARSLDVRGKFSQLLWGIWIYGPFSYFCLIPWWTTLPRALKCNITMYDILFHSKLDKSSFVAHWSLWKVFVFVCVPHYDSYSPLLFLRSIFITIISAVVSRYASYFCFVLSHIISFAIWVNPLFGDRDWH